MKSILTAALVSLTLLAAPAGADKPLGMEEVTSVDDFAYAIAAFFPKVQGEVTAVQGDQMAIALGKKHGLMPGMVLSVWRDGREILHPVTKAVIGRAENEVGTAEVTAVQEKTSSAVLKKRLLEPREGDRARITPKKIGLGILPLRDDKPEIISGLTERLGELGRFTLPPKDKVAAFLKDHKQRDASLVKEMGKVFALDAVVAVSVHPSEGKYLVSCQLFAADDGKQMDTITAMLNLTTKRDALGEVRPFFAPVKIQADGKMPDVPFDARYFSIVDLDGDGNAEHVFSNGMHLAVYRAAKGAWTEVWKEAVPKKEREMQQFALDVADINGNGRPEIFVTRMLNGIVSSYAIEFQDGAFKRIADIPGFLRVVPQPRRGAVLIGRDYDPDSFYTGKPREFSWNGTAYVPGPDVVLPSNVDLYGFVYADLGEERPLVVAYDKDNRLVVYSSGAAVWRSEEEYVTTATVLQLPRTGLDSNVSTDPTVANYGGVPVAGVGLDKTRRVKISGRLVAADLSGSGKDDLIVVNNPSSSLLGSSKGAEVVVLRWTRGRLEPGWAAKDLSGRVLDLQVSLVAAGGAQISGLVRVSGGMFGRDSARVEQFEGK